MWCFATLTYIFKVTTFLEIYKYKICGKRWELAINSQVGLYRSCYSQSNGVSRMASLRMLCIRTDVRFQGHEYWTVYIWKTVRASEKCSSVTFIEFDIWHRMAPFRTLYVVTSNFIFKVKLFLWICYKKVACYADVRGRFASSRTAPAVELLLLVVIKATLVGLQEML